MFKALRYGMLGSVSAFAFLAFAAPATSNVVTLPTRHLSPDPLLWEAQGIGPGADEDRSDPDDDDDDSGWKPRPGSSRPTRPLLLPPTTVLDPQDTGIVIKYLEDSTSLCDRLPQRYKVDCLGTQIGALVDRLPDTQELAPAKQALRTAAADLERIVRQNAVRGGDRITAAIPGVMETDAPLRPVRGERLPAANAQAAAVIDEATTVLLRSAAGGGDIGASYQRIAAAVDSTKVLLRST